MHPEPAARADAARQPRRARAALWIVLGIGACGTERAGDGEAATRAALDPLTPRPALSGTPTRILPSSLRALEFLAVLVGPERIAAVPEQAFEYAALGAEGAALEELPRFYAFLAETVLAFEPDLVLGDPWQAPETNARLREAGVSLVVLPETGDWRASGELLVELARLLDVEDRGRAVVLELERRVTELERGTGARSGLRVVPYSNFGSQGFTAGADTTLDEMIRLAGMRNAAAANGRAGNVGLGFEELLVLDPDVIVVSRPLQVPAGHTGDRGGAAREVLMGEPALAGLRAVREGRIVDLPPGLFACASQRVVAGAEALAAEVDGLLRELDGAREAVGGAQR